MKWTFDVFYYATDAFTKGSHFRTVLEKPGTVTINYSAFSNLSKLTVCGGKLSSSTNRHGAILVSCVKNSETPVTSKSNSELFYCTNIEGKMSSELNFFVIICVFISNSGDPNGAVLEKKSPSSMTFPNGFEVFL